MSALAEVFGIIESTWEALTPPDRTEVTYARVDGPDLNDGASGDRCFWFEVQGGTPTGEAGLAFTEYSHRITARVRLERAAYNQRDFEARIANEAVLLQRAIDRLTTPLGTSSRVQEIITQGYAPGGAQRDSIVLSLPIVAMVQETDTI